MKTTETNETDNCNECIFAYLQDTGYSNYTIEGIDIYCILNLNPKLPTDRWYGQDLTHVLVDCDSFVKGTSTPHLDVDREDDDFINYVNDPLLKAMIRMNPKLVEGL